MQVLGPALVVLALALIVLYETGARRPAAGAGPGQARTRRRPSPACPPSPGTIFPAVDYPLSGPVRPVVDGR